MYLWTSPMILICGPATAWAPRIMALHILPQCVAPYLVLATTHLGVAIVIEAALGF
jgi:ABC-type dipeptide/oligopeptide/nickel transport system permease subunit